MPSQESRHIKLILGENILAARKAQGLTQRELAQELEIDQFSISRWERGIVLPNTASLLKLSEALSVDLGWLYTDHGRSAA